MTDPTAMTDPQTIVEGMPAWTQGHEKPGKLNETQREYLLSAADFHEGEPIPFCQTHIPYQGRYSYNGLVSRGFFAEYGHGFARLTPKGYRAVRAILSLRSDRHAAYQIEQIDAFMAAQPTSLRTHLEKESKK